MNERRDLAGLTATGTGGTAVARKGGLPTLDGMLEVPFEYRDTIYAVRCASDATAAEVAALMQSLIAAADAEAEDGSLVGEVMVI